MWLHCIVRVKIFISKSLCLCTSNPNIEPQRIIGLTSGAPDTFSITYNLPVFLRACLVWGMRLGYFSGKSGRAFKQNIKTPIGSIAKAPNLHNWYTQWGYIKYNTYAIIKQLYQSSVQVWQRYYTINRRVIQIWLLEAASG